MATTETDNIRELSPEQGRELVDKEARRRLGMSGDEFIAAWKEGRFAGPERTDVMEVAMLLPLVDDKLLYIKGTS